MKIKTYTICSCGKKFVNKTEVGHAFAIGTHEIKQFFYNAAAWIHCLIHKHKIEKFYEEWVKEE